MNLKTLEQHHSGVGSRQTVPALLLIKVPIMGGLFLFISADSGKNLAPALTILAFNSGLMYGLYRLTIRSRYLSRRMALAKAHAKAQQETLERSTQKIRAVTKIQHDYDLDCSEAKQDLKNHEFSIKRSRDQKLERKQAVTDQLARLRSEFENELLRIGIDAKGIFGNAIGHCISAEAQSNRIKPRYCNKRSDPKLLSSLTAEAESQFGRTVDTLISQINPINRDPELDSQP